MGSLLSRLNNQLNNNTVEEAETMNNYKYPPKNGNFFSESFIMGGERFERFPDQECYLFGDNLDLNWLGSKPIAFPYLPPKNTEPTKTLKSLVNVRKESVKFVKADGDGKGYNIEFVFDADMKCTIKVYYFCTEEITANSITYLSREAVLTTETFYYQKGPSQIFSQPAHIFRPHKYTDDDLQYSPEKDIYPIAIHCVVDEIGDGNPMHSHTTICVVDHHASDNEYHLRAMKQKIFVDGLCYLLQEIYGIENKNLTRPMNDDDDEDNGSECVICICEPRDTLILPCRHLCLCNGCADSLRYQANNCPICRAPFRALLQIRAVQKTNTPIININPQDSAENIPIGFQPVPLIEALNGPGFKLNSIDRKDANAINKDSDQKVSPASSLKRSSKEKVNGSTDHFRISALLSGDENADLYKRSPTVTRSANNKEKKNISRSSSNKERDCVKYINEKSASNDMDDDSEAEKLSPLLVTDDRSHENNTRINSEEDSPEDNDNDKTNMMTDDLESKADDSDYYTPEDPHTTILSPVKSPLDPPEKKDIVTPLSIIKDNQLPDSPISGNSQVSTRSSGGESYSSSSSTRQLLSSAPVENSKASGESQNKN